MNVYCPTKSPEILRLLEVARQNVHELDDHDKQRNVATPTEGELTLGLRTVLVALITGLEMNNQAIIAEGVVMLQDIELNQRQQRTSHQRN